MDKNEAVRVSKNYVKKVRKNGFNILDVWLFGSYAKGNFNENSDIDIAIILPDNQLTFDTDVHLMALRKGEETMIETHTYSKNDFLINTPIVEQIKRYGFRI
ncbi:MAG: nucleotidyltransferase domain-containing protein [Candidatus Azobacteroides sp.]|nr:nucleotidyltransferase domain-containing protein [Candidatus Azobacteroides sp.]